MLLKAREIALYDLDFGVHFRIIQRTRFFFLERVFMLIDRCIGVHMTLLPYCCKTSNTVYKLVDLATQTRSYR